MYRSILIPVLLLLALGSLIYAIYRSAAETIIITEGTRQTIYGDPQHGLILGLCIFAGICIASTIPLLRERRDVVTEERTVLGKRVP
jgi:hypothetical protein